MSWHDRISYTPFYLLHVETKPNLNKMNMYPEIILILLKYLNTYTNYNLGG